MGNTYNTDVHPPTTGVCGSCTRRRGRHHMPYRHAIRHPSHHTTPHHHIRPLNSPTRCMSHMHPSDRCTYVGLICLVLSRRHRDTQTDSSSTAPHRTASLLAQTSVCVHRTATARPACWGCRRTIDRSIDGSMVHRSFHSVDCKNTTKRATRGERRATEGRKEDAIYLPTYMRTYTTHPPAPPHSAERTKALAGDE